MSFPLISITKCPVCLSEARLFLWKVGEVSVFRCKKCALGYLDPALNPESMAAAYESTESLIRLHQFHEGYYEYTDLSKTTRTRAEFLNHLTNIEKYLPKEMARRVLDIGYGNGMFLALAKSRGWQVEGLDTSPQNAASAKKNYDLNLNVGFFQDSCFKQSFSVITMLDVIEHQINPHAFIRKAHELLKPGGLLLIALPNEDSFLRFLSQILYRLSFGNMTLGLKMVYVLEHVAYYNTKTLSKLFEVNGFEPVDFFFTSTDLKKYNLSGLQQLAGEVILFFGKLFGMQNRLTMIVKKPGA